MPLKELRAETKLIQKFDQLGDRFLAEVLDYCQRNEIVEEEQMVRQTVKVIRDRASAQG
jgi:vesicle coat complex subunit